MRGGGRWGHRGPRADEVVEGAVPLTETGGRPDRVGHEGQGPLDRRLEGMAVGQARRNRRREGAPGSVGVPGPYPGAVPAAFGATVPEKVHDLGSLSMASLHERRA